MIDKLPTELLVSAQIRTAAREGVAIYLRRRGDGTSGSILLKINKMDGTAVVLSQVRLDDQTVWTPSGGSEDMTDDMAEGYIERQLEADPDLWVLEIEDRLGRHWFPGRVVTL